MCARHPSPALAARPSSPVEARQKPPSTRAPCDEFISLASHELLTPVTALRLQAQHIRRLLSQHPEEVPARIPSMVETFDRQLGRLALLCDELLHATQIVASELPLACEDVDLAELVGDIVDRAAPRPSARALVTIRVSGAPRGRWDRMLVEQLVLHLVRNALVYGEGRPVAIDVARVDGGARIVVKDHGIGIAPEDHARIFERFERAVPPSRFGGLGLGLYIARAAAEAHGGSIRVESAPGEGATFIVELPTEAGVARRALDRAPRARSLGLTREARRRSRSRRTCSVARARPSRTRAS
ncbi:HAMP domain-containing sensor histidine kinase [Polyangium sp. 6x1]|uniref:sensor histidine kinase n=1 Tax=Polyangium sp. 6x1 TaxID=3042689 RepID=UPI002482CA00|nr:HAMP domain-containing sensor histidine kinase [Polyangium sp. 6x1]MDI1446328.1 HAMP domain-containing sensor histidine kinase [Polyangium sp. 6x1]